MSAQGTACQAFTFAVIFSTSYCSSRLASYGVVAVRWLRERLGIGFRTSVGLGLRFAQGISFEKRRQSSPYEAFPSLTRPLVYG